MEAPPAPRRTRDVIDSAGAVCWRLIGIGIVVIALLWLARELAVVLAPLVVALFVVRGLAPVAGWLRRRRFSPVLAAVTAMLSVFAVLCALGALIVPALVDQADSLGPTLSEATDDIENWLVDDSPFEISRSTIDELRDRTSSGVDRLFNIDHESVTTGAMLAAEIVAGALLAVFLTFFMLRDGERFVDSVIARARTDRRATLRRAADRGWAVLGGYLLGAAVLGLVESVIIGLTLLLAGGDLVVPVMIITFFGAFIPIAGALAAGVVAVLVGLVTGGLGTAVIVAIVALVVQQLDNDLLAPWIYGKALSLHPVAVLLSVVAGGALFGFVGTFLAVPVVAVAAGMSKELRPATTNAPVGQ
jgi:predicted PurR-regulated permease PerM